MDISKLRLFQDNYEPVLSTEDIQHIEKNVERAAKDPKFSRAMQEVADLQASYISQDRMMAYYVFCFHKLLVENLLMKRRIKALGVKHGVLFTQDEIDSLGGQESAYLEQVHNVSKGIVKPAYKKDITPEQVKALYDKLGTQQKVADYLGVDIKTVRSRLKQ